MNAQHVEELNAHFRALETTVQTQNDRIEQLTLELAQHWTGSQRLVSELTAKFTEQETTIMEMKAVQKVHKNGRRETCLSQQLLQLVNVRRNLPRSSVCRPVC